MIESSAPVSELNSACMLRMDDGLQYSSTAVQPHACTQGSSAATSLEAQLIDCGSWRQLQRIHCLSLNP